MIREKRQNQTSNTLTECELANFCTAGPVLPASLDQPRPQAYTHCDLDLSRMLDVECCKNETCECVDKSAFALPHHLRLPCPQPPFGSESIEKYCAPVRDIQDQRAIVSCSGPESSRGLCYTKPLCETDLTMSGSGVANPNATMSPTLEPSVSTASPNQTETTPAATPNEPEYPTNATMIPRDQVNRTLTECELASFCSADPISSVPGRQPHDQYYTHCTLELRDMLVDECCNENETCECVDESAFELPHLPLRCPQPPFGSQSIEKYCAPVRNIQDQRAIVSCSDGQVGLCYTKPLCETDPTTQLPTNVTISPTLEPSISTASPNQTESTPVLMSTMTPVSPTLTPTSSTIPEGTELPTENKENDNKPFYYALGAGALALSCAVVSTICGVYQCVTKRKIKSRNDQHETISLSSQIQTCDITLKECEVTSKPGKSGIYSFACKKIFFWKDNDTYV